MKKLFSWIKILFAFSVFFVLLLDSLFSTLWFLAIVLIILICFVLTNTQWFLHYFKIRKFFQIYEWYDEMVDTIALVYVLILCRLVVKDIFVIQNVFVGPWGRISNSRILRLALKDRGGILCQKDFKKESKILTK